MATAIKIPRDVFLKRLKAKLAESDANHKKNDELRKKHAATQKKWEADVLKYMLKNAAQISYVHVTYDKSVTLRAEKMKDLPEEPGLDLLDALSSYERDELLQTIAIVELSDAEFVPASITKNASRFLI